MIVKIEYVVGYDGEGDECTPITRSVTLKFREEDDHLVLKITKEGLSDLVDMARKQGLNITAMEEI